MAARICVLRGLRALLRQGPSFAASGGSQLRAEACAAASGVQQAASWRDLRSAPWNLQVRWQSAQTEAVKPEAELQLTETCVERLKQLRAESPDSPLSLRISVEGGGCSGFQYRFDIDSSDPRPDDKVISAGDANVVVDSVSYDFLKGAKLDFSEELIRASFQVVDNPNTEKSCGCGSSFSVK